MEGIELREKYGRYSMKQKQEYYCKGQSEVFFSRSAVAACRHIFTVALFGWLLVFSWAQQKALRLREHTQCLLVVKCKL